MVSIEGEKELPFTYKFMRKVIRFLVTNAIYKNHCLYTSTIN